MLDLIGFFDRLHKVRFDGVFVWAAKHFFFWESLERKDLKGRNLLTIFEDSQEPCYLEMNRKLPWQCIVEFVEIVEYAHGVVPEKV